jgi:hypothetical protein
VTVEVDAEGREMEGLVGAEEVEEGRRHRGLEKAESGEAERGDVGKAMKQGLEEEEIKDFLLHR